MAACHATGANRDISYVPEIVYGTTPANPRFKTLRTTGDSLKGTIETQSSSELIKGRVDSAPVMGRVSGGGGIPVEMSFRTFDDFLAAMLFAEWEPYPAAGVGATRLRLGTKANPGEAQSFTIERFFSDIVMYRYYTGCLVNTFDLSVPLDGKVTGSFGIMAKNNPDPLDLPLAGETYDPEFPTNTDQFTSFIGGLFIKDVDGGDFVPADAIAYATQIDLKVNNNMQADNVLFSKEAGCITPGKFQVGGTVSMYLKDKTFIKYVNDWETLKLYFELSDASVGGNTYRFVLGSLKFTDAPDGVSSPNAITLALPFTAFGQDALQVIRIPSAAENRVLMPIFTRTGNNVTMAAHPENPDGATVEIRYTLDGTEPTATSTRYTAAVDITAGGTNPSPVTVKAVAFDTSTNAYAKSRTHTEEYTYT